MAWAGSHACVKCINVTLCEHWRTKNGEVHVWGWTTGFNLEVSCCRETANRQVIVHGDDWVSLTNERRWGLDDRDEAYASYTLDGPSTGRQSVTDTFKYTCYKASAAILCKKNNTILSFKIKSYIPENLITRRCSTLLIPPPHGRD